jgi:hypothetical protein
LRGEVIEMSKTFAGISAPQILAARKTYGKWEEVGRFFHIRKQTIMAIAKEFGIDTAKRIKVKPIVKPKLTKAAKYILKRIDKAKAVKAAKKLVKTLKYREAQHYQLIFKAQFMCPMSENPTPEITGYSLGRRRHGFPSPKEQEEMREEAVSSAISLNLDGNSDCYPLEETVKVEIKEYDPKTEGERLRKVKAKIKRKRDTKKERSKRREIRKRR